MNGRSVPSLRALSENRSVVSDSLRPHRLYSPRNSPDQNTGVGSLSLLQWIFVTWESNQGLLHCKWILYQLSYQGAPPLVFRSCSHTFLNGTKIFQLFIIRKTMHPFLNCTDYVFLDSSQILTALEDSGAVTS